MTMQHATAQLTPPRYIRARRLATQLDVSVATVWRWTAAGRLPPPHRLGPGVTAWAVDEVVQHLAAAERGDDGGPRAA